VASDLILQEIEGLKGWIGRSEVTHDEITPRLVSEMNATLDRDPTPPSAPTAAPEMIHWCLAPQIIQRSGLGPDGHPAKGGFLPPIPLPRRMWAGGKVNFRAPLLVGDKIERRATIQDLTVKQGRSGVLCFLTVRQDILTSRGLAIEEYQDIVYRDVESAPAAPAAPPPPPPEPAWSLDMRADPTMLFRYSAITFNGHRIHYDRSYTVDVEKYPGLLVHGPLQATLLVQFASSIKSAGPAQFNFRAVQPLFDDAALRLCAIETETGLRVWIETKDRRTTMQAEASWAP
jgi:3-methylfumaryl-CoA hydratase